MKPLLLFILLSTAALGQDKPSRVISGEIDTAKHWLYEIKKGDSAYHKYHIGTDDMRDKSLIEGFGYKLTGLPAWILVTAIIIVTVSIIIAGFFAIIVPLWLWIIEKAIGFFNFHETIVTYILNRKEFKNWLNRKK